MPLNAWDSGEKHCENNLKFGLRKLSTHPRSNSISDLSTSLTRRGQERFPSKPSINAQRFENKANLNENQNLYFRKPKSQGRNFAFLSFRGVLSSMWYARTHKTQNLKVNIIKINSRIRAQHLQKSLLDAKTAGCFETNIRNRTDKIFVYLMIEVGGSVVDRLNASFECPRNCSWSVASP